jgi:ABC-type dipeptide/oligopeptide/nickel transport system ATPase component
MSREIVKITNLTIHFSTIDGISQVLNCVNLEIREKEIVGLVGETGCGKSVTSKILLGVLPKHNSKIIDGEIKFLDKNILNI